MMAWPLRPIAVCALGCVLLQPARAETRYVAITGTNPASPYLTWDTAATNIQDAIDVSVSSDTVVVSNGVYATGGRVVHGAMTNRVAITNAITVRSLNGPAQTTIRGAGPIGDAAVRCAYVGNGATLSGFMLTNGATRQQGNKDFEWSGGGAWCAPSATISNCIFSGNIGGYNAGGVYGGTVHDSTFIGNVSGGGGAAYTSTLHHCTLVSNSAAIGGGSYYSTLYGCTLSGNSALYGAGSDYGTLINCLLTANSASNAGGGCFAGTLYNCTIVANTAGESAGGVYGAVVACNCIVYFNTAPSDPNFFDLTGLQRLYSCCVVPRPKYLAENITNDPQFVEAANANFHLKATSPCIDRGDSAEAQAATDLDGNPRVAYGVVDLGVYEAQFPVGYWVWASTITNGLTNLTDCAAGDGYPNLLKYATGSSSTNSDGLAAMAGDFTNGGFFLRFSRDTNAIDATLIVEGSNAATNDAAWTGIATNFVGSWGGAPNVVEAGAGSPVRVSVTDRTTPQGPPDQGGAASTRFLRLRVTRP